MDLSNPPSLFQCDQQSWAARGTTGPPPAARPPSGGSEHNTVTDTAPSSTNSPKESDLTSIWSNEPSHLSNTVNVSLSNALSEKLNIIKTVETSLPQQQQPQQQQQQQQPVHVQASSSGMGMAGQLNTLNNINCLQVIGSNRQ